MERQNGQILSVEITDKGSLWLSAELVEMYFPFNLLFAIVRGKELWLLPAHGPGAGGLILKQRNAKGDRSVLIWEVLPENTLPGTRNAFWDERQSALRVGLELIREDLER